MSDLISRSALIDYIKMWDVGCGIGHNQKTFIEAIARQPIAYDVDAVVEELEKNKTPLKEAVVANHISISINNELIKIKNSDIDKYIAIVRRGGVNENNN